MAVLILFFNAEIGIIQSQIKLEKGNFWIKEYRYLPEFGHTHNNKYHQTRSNMAKVASANEYAVHLLLSGGHREEVRFPTVQEFQKWYSSELMPKSSSTDFITVPLKNSQGEYMLIRPSCIEAVRIEPVFASSVDRDY